jgi:hypothetical protein
MQLSVNFAESKCNSLYIHQEPKITFFNATLNLVMRVFIIYEATNSFFISLLHPSTNLNDQIRLTVKAKVAIFEAIARSLK